MDHDGPHATPAGRGVGRREGRTLFPASLRLVAAGSELGAAGLRARIAQDGDELEVEIDGRRARIRVQPPITSGAVALWPFGAMRTIEAAPDVAATSECVFAAADQPVAMFIRDGEPIDARRLDVGPAAAPIVIDVVQLDERWSALLMHDRGFGVGDASSIIAATVARARRRAAARPIATIGSGTDPFAAAEHELRGELRRGTDGAIEMAAPLTEQIIAVMALHALNDSATANELARSLAAHVDDAVASLLIGASAAWRGTAPDVAGLRHAASAWLRDVAATGTSARDAITSAALATAPAAAEALGATDVLGALRRQSSVHVVDAWRRLAHDADGSPAAAVLLAMHGVIGVAPDALRGRVAIRPATVAYDVTVEQIVVGDGVLAFRAEADAECATFEVEQTAGGTPLTLLLEPRVPGRRLRSARVDETAAQLDAFPEESDLRVKVQLVADRPRRLELRYER
ncbi:MAG TPA: hypothetical protein VF039_04430 [Longimicrobiales bacterium]